MGVCVRGQNRLLHVLQSSPILNVLVPPQVGVFPPHGSSGAGPPVPQRSSLQPVVPQVCMCVAHVCVGVGGGDGCVYVRVYLNKTTIVFHSPPNGRCRFPHRLVSPLPMCSGEQFHLTVSFHPLHSQYRQHHLDRNKHRSVCGVGGGDELWMCVWVAQCRLCKVTSFIAIRSSTTVRTCFTYANLEWK